MVMSLGMRNRGEICRGLDMDVAIVHFHTILCVWGETSGNKLGKKYLIASRFSP